MPESPQFSDLQLALMRVLWDQGEASAAQVHGALAQAQRELAPTTVATLLSRLEKRGLVAHRTKGRQYIYRALMAESDVRRSMVARLTAFFFGGDTQALLSHLVDDPGVGEDELDRVKTLIAAKERESKAGADG